MLFQLWLIQAEDTAGHADPCDLGASTLFMHFWVADSSKSFQKYWIYYSPAQNIELLHVAVVLQGMHLYFCKDLYVKEDDVWKVHAITNAVFLAVL